MTNGVNKKGLLKYETVLTGNFPMEVTFFSSCNITIGDEDFLVLWEFSAPTTSDESPDHGEDLDEVTESDIETNDEDDEAELNNMIHCLPFKVMGVTYNTQYQTHLEAAKAVGLDSVSARIDGEPGNANDSNAIAVAINYGTGWVKVGYIAKELTQFIHPLIAEGKIVRVDVKHIKFCIVYMRVGYYITITISRKGQWEQQVVRASKRVK